MNAYVKLACMCTLNVNTKLLVIVFVIGLVRKSKSARVSYSMKVTLVSFTMVIYHRISYNLTKLAMAK